MSLPAPVALPMGAGDARLLNYAISAYLIGYARKTRENRSRDLGDWIGWCADHDLDVLHDVRREHIQGYATHLLEDRQLAVTTVCGALTSICGLYRSAHRDELITRDPSAHVTHPQRPRRPRSTHLLRDELAQLIDLAMADDDPACGALVCLCGLQSLRISEVVGLDVAHLGHVGGWTTITIDRGKEVDGRDVISLAPTTVQAVQRAVDGRRDGPLLLGRTGNRLRRDTARRRLHRLARAAGIDRRITPHSLRYTHITLARDAHVPDAHIQASTGHRDATMIGWYDQGRAGVERNSSHEVDQYVRGAR